MKSKIFAFLAVFAVKIMSVGPLPELDNPRDEVAVLSHYRQLPYHLRQSAHAISILFNQSINDNRDQPIIDAAGEEFGNLDDYKASLDSGTYDKLQIIEANDSLKSQPAWVYANPYVLFFWGVLSNHTNFQKRESIELHNLVSKMGYDRDNHLESESENISVQADQRAKQFWSIVGEKVDLAVDQGNPYAQLIKGLCFVDGISLGQDANRGLHLIKRAANQHLLPALEFLTVYLDSAVGQRYVGRGPNFIFNSKQLQRYNNYAKVLTNPFNELNKKIESLGGEKKNPYQQQKKRN